MLLDGVPTAELKAQAAAIVIRAKTHAYSITAYDLADVLPARDEKNLVDALLRLRECLDVDRLRRSRRRAGTWCTTDSPTGSTPAKR